MSKISELQISWQMDPQPSGRRRTWRQETLCLLASSLPPSWGLRRPWNDKKTAKKVKNLVELAKRGLYSIESPGRTSSSNCVACAISWSFASERSWLSASLWSAPDGASEDMNLTPTKVDKQLEGIHFRTFGHFSPSKNLMAVRIFRLGIKSRGLT